MQQLLNKDFRDAIQVVEENPKLLEDFDPDSYEEVQQLVIRIKLLATDKPSEQIRMQQT